MAVFHRTALPLQDTTGSNEHVVAANPEAQKQLMHEKEGLVQQNQQLNDKLMAAQTEVQQLKGLVASTSTEVDDLRSKVPYVTHLMSFNSNSGGRF